MNQFGPPIVSPLLPPTGIVFFTTAENSAIAVSRDICKVASFLQAHQPHVKCIRLDHWWEHDGLFFEKGSLDLHGLFQIVGTPRSLLEAMSGDDRVFVGVAATDRTWYLRFLVGWHDNGELILGEYSITLDDSLSHDFMATVPEMACPIQQEEAASFFAKRRG